ncbi:hypothetical protein ACS3UN_07465 [Oscillospiraceae bacterium LTW-04]|nr:hypothetical protein RBH76_02875 [Oscillospiraceae bacterium MB24-C1]
MKQFLSTFFICLVFCVVSAFFFAELLMRSFWANIVVIALFLAILITAFISQDARIETLEKKVKQLQGESEPPPSDSF